MNLALLALGLTILLVCVIRRWFRRRCHSVPVTNTVRVVKTDHSHCCQGYQGVECRLPICSNCNGDTGFCIAPNNCVCKSSFTGSQCDTAKCSWEQNCYPGTCTSNTCSCASGFTGNNCEKIINRAEYRKCNVSITGSDVRLSQVTQTVDGSCNAGSNILEAAGKVRVKNIEKISLDWEAAYQITSDADGSRQRYPPYMHVSNQGIEDAYTTMSTSSNEIATKKVTCDKPPTPTIPYLTAQCINESFGLRGTVTSGTTLTVAMYTKIGGYKSVRNTDAGGIQQQRYSGEATTFNLRIGFDLDRPQHCSETNTCSTNQEELSEPIAIIPEVGKQGELKLMFEGWKDKNDKEWLDQIQYQFYRMTPDRSGILREGAVPVFTGTWTLRDPLPKYDFGNDSLVVSVRAKVMDKVGNYARARALAIVDVLGSVEINQVMPLTASAAYEPNSMWISAKDTTLTNPDVITFSWTGRYFNKMMMDRKLLSRASEISEIEVEDKFGDRTISAVANENGIVRFQCDMRHISGAAAVSDLNDRTWIDLDTKSQVTYTIPRIDRDIIKVYIMVNDLTGLNVSEEKTFYVDSTPPVVSAIDDLTYEKNTNVRIDGVPHFNARVTTLAYDDESGVTRIEYFLESKSNADFFPVEGKNGSFMVQEIDQSLNEYCKTECSCNMLGKCYNKTVQALVDNCLFYGLNGEHTYRLRFEVMNNATLSFKSYKEVDLLGIDGVTQNTVPPPVDINLEQANFETALITWKNPKACLATSQIKVEFEGDEKEVLLKLPGATTSHTFEDIPRGQEIIMHFSIIYENNVESESFPYKVFLPARGMSAAGIAGVTIGLIIVVPLLVIAVITIVILIFRKRDVEPPTFLRFWEERFTNYGIMKEHVYGKLPSKRKAISHNTNNAYEPEYASAAEPDMMEEGVGLTPRDLGIKENNKTQRKSDKGVEDEDEEDYIYLARIPPQETNGNFRLKEEIAKGNFAVIRKAGVIEAGQERQVAAKMPKDKNTEENILLIKSKMKFLSDVPSHPNLVNYISSSPSDLVLFLELCDAGNMTDWIKKIKHGLDADTTQQLFQFCLDISRAIQHLHDHKIIHRRLSMRNVLLKTEPQGLVAKVTGFGPLKEDVNKKQNSLPIKWMAPELLKDSGGSNSKIKYTTNSDIWACGVTFFEILSLGKKPYQDIKQTNLMTEIRDYGRLPGNSDCLGYETILLPCWNKEPLKRPTADDLCEIVEDSLNSSVSPYDNVHIGEDNQIYVNYK